MTADSPRVPEAAQPDIHVNYGPMEQFYDQDSEFFRIVKKRYETWVENGEKFGRWDYVPASQSEADADV